MTRLHFGIKLLSLSAFAFFAPLNSVRADFSVTKQYNSAGRNCEPPRSRLKPTWSDQPICITEDVAGKIKLYGTKYKSSIYCVPDVQVGGNCTPGTFNYIGSNPAAPYQLNQVNRTCTYYYECCFTLENILEILYEVQGNECQ
jgi:hypothetical protein